MSYARLENKLQRAALKDDKSRTHDARHAIAANLVATHRFWLFNSLGFFILIWLFGWANTLRQGPSLTDNCNALHHYQENLLRQQHYQQGRSSPLSAVGGGSGLSASGVHDLWLERSVMSFPRIRCQSLMSLMLTMLTYVLLTGVAAILFVVYGAHLDIATLVSCKLIAVYADMLAEMLRFGAGLRKATPSGSVDMEEAEETPLISMTSVGDSRVAIEPGGGRYISVNSDCDQPSPRLSDFEHSSFPPCEFLEHEIEKQTSAPSPSYIPAPGTTLLELTSPRSHDLSEVVRTNKSGRQEEVDQNKTNSNIALTWGAGAAGKGEGGGRGSSELDQMYEELLNFETYMCVTTRGVAFRLSSFPVAALGMSGIAVGACRIIEEYALAMRAVDPRVQSVHRLTMSILFFPVGWQLWISIRMLRALTMPNRYFDEIVIIGMHQGLLVLCEGFFCVFSR